MTFPLAASAADLIRCSGSGAARNLAENVEPAAADERLTYVKGSTFLIETANSTLAATDFVDGLTSGQIPDLVTIHSGLAQNFEVISEPRTARILTDSINNRWASNWIEYGQIYVLNLPSALRGSTGRIDADNSIFVFGVGGLCIAQFGQLNH